jgi:anti-sigma regulatory factor (Ser/Thr protein kinase)
VCNRGVVWGIETADALSALRARKQYLAAVRRHERWTIDESAAAIIFGELVANAVCHAPGPVRISLECVGQSTVLTVIDNGPGFEFKPALLPDVLAEDGRGLFIVSRFATAFRVEKCPGVGMRVIATLPTRPRIVA